MGKRKGLRQNDNISILGCKLTPLHEFKTGQFGPSTKDVRKFKFHKDPNKKEKLALNETANTLIKVWKPARIPLMTKVNVVRKIRSLVKCHRKLKY